MQDVECILSPIGLAIDGELLNTRHARIRSSSTKIIVLNGSPLKSDSINIEFRTQVSTSKPPAGERAQSRQERSCLIGW
jgi:hypothetical protein